MLQSLRRVREAWARGAAQHPSKAVAGDTSSHGSDGGSAEDVSTGSVACFHLDDVAGALAGDAPSTAMPQPSRRASFTLSLRRDLAPSTAAAVDDAAAPVPRRPPAAAGGGLAAAAVPAAAQPPTRSSSGRLDPRSTAYQVSVLLSPSTFFEHKTQSDALRALRSIPACTTATQSAAAAGADGTGIMTSGASAGAPLAPSSSMHGSSGAAAARWGAGASGHVADVARVALALRRWGYTLVVRRVIHSTYWTKSFHNTFIVALDMSSSTGVEYIVDPHFKDKFLAAAPGEGYRAAWEALPPVLVAMPAQLQPVVQLLCEEIEQSFLAAGRPCPPWRGWAATINRFMSHQFIDIHVPGPDAGEAEAEAFVARCAAAAAAATAGVPVPAARPEGSASASSSGGGSCEVSAEDPSCGAIPTGASAAKQKAGAVLSSASGGGGGHGSSRTTAGMLSLTSGSGGGAGRLRRPVQQPLRAQVGFQAPKAAVAAVSPSLDSSSSSNSSNASTTGPKGKGGRVAAAAAAAEAAAAAAGGGSGQAPLVFGPAPPAVRRVRSSPFIYNATVAAAGGGDSSSSNSSDSDTKPPVNPVSTAVSGVTGVSGTVTSDTDEEMAVLYHSGSCKDESSGSAGNSGHVNHTPQPICSSTMAIKPHHSSFDESDASTPFEDSSEDDGDYDTCCSNNGTAAAHAAGSSQPSRPAAGQQQHGLLSASLQRARAREAQAAAFLAGIPNLPLPLSSGRQQALGS